MPPKDEDFESVVRAQEKGEKQKKAKKAVDTEVQIPLRSVDVGVELAQVIENFFTDLDFVMLFSLAVVISFTASEFGRFVWPEYF